MDGYVTEIYFLKLLLGLARDLFQLRRVAVSCDSAVLAEMMVGKTNH